MELTPYMALTSSPSQSMLLATERSGCCVRITKVPFGYRTSTCAFVGDWPAVTYGANENGAMAT